MQQVVKHMYLRKGKEIERRKEVSINNLQSLQSYFMSNIFSKSVMFAINPDFRKKTQENLCLLRCQANDIPRAK